MLRALSLLLALPALADPACAPDTLWIRTPDGQVQRIAVEVADEAAERAKGLMNRDHLPAASGMLFVYDRPGKPVFWMKNTLISLDILFARPDGTIALVHEKAQPMDETHIPGGEGIQFVLEIGGGLAAPMGLVPGAVLRHPAIARETAAWPCE